MHACELGVQPGALWPRTSTRSARTFFWCLIFSCNTARRSSKGLPPGGHGSSRSSWPALGHVGCFQSSVSANRAEVTFGS